MATELAASISLPAGVPGRRRRTSSAARVWSGLWPKLVAVAFVVAVWQLVAWSGWKPQAVLPGPVSVVHRLEANLGQPDFYAGIVTTLRRALVGYAAAAFFGVAVAVVVARMKILRRAVAAGLVGLQSMPSIAWFPFAVLVLARGEAAITFVVVLGAGPAIATGLLSGIDQVQPIQIRVGRSMGAAGLQLYRHVILPAALPAFVVGLKQGWAFAWRSLMSAELLVAAGAAGMSLGVQLQVARSSGDTQQLFAVMIVIFLIGVTVDALFGGVERSIRTRWGLVGAEP